MISQTVKYEKKVEMLDKKINESKKNCHWTIRFCFCQKKCSKNVFKCSNKTHLTLSQMFFFGGGSLSTLTFTISLNCNTDSFFTSDESYT